MLYNSHPISNILRAEINKYCFDDNHLWGKEFLQQIKHEKQFKKWQCEIMEAEYRMRRTAGCYI